MTHPQSRLPEEQLVPHRANAGQFPKTLPGPSSVTSLRDASRHLCLCPWPQAPAPSLHPIRHRLQQPEWAHSIRSHAILNKCRDFAFQPDRIRKHGKQGRDNADDFDSAEENELLRFC